MIWYEHLFGVLAVLWCFVGVPLGSLAISCIIVGARNERY